MQCIHPRKIVHLWKWAHQPFVLILLTKKCVVAQQATLGLESIPTTYTNQACTSHDGPHTKKVDLINECVVTNCHLPKTHCHFYCTFFYGTFLSFTYYNMVGTRCCCWYVGKRHTMGFGPILQAVQKHCLLLLFFLVCPRPNPSFAQKRYMVPKHTLAPSTIRYTLAPCYACFGHIFDTK